jgi:leucyl-tRNA synthetase
MEMIEGEGPYDCKKDPPLEGAMRELRLITHKTIKKVTLDIEERFHFNTAISSIMELVNALYLFRQKKGAGESEADARLGQKVFSEAVTSVVLLLSPFAPHLAEELWEMLGNDIPVYKTPWPAFDADALVTEEVTLVVQINGKVRSRISVPMDASKDEAVQRAMKDSKVIEWSKDKEIKKLIYVPNKILNMVVA